MNIDKLIEHLEELKKEHGGDVEVNLWIYAGRESELCNVMPVFDKETERVILETFFV